MYHNKSNRTRQSELDAIEQREEDHMNDDNDIVLLSNDMQQSHAIYRHKKQLMEQLCASKCEQEIAEQELYLLQQSITSNNSSSEPFDYSTLSKVT
ncbi:unnamed protein product [Rotaria sp. Silwood1]|nr:unnamed protein product [Rotaria sp. Silwood1]